MSVTFVSALIDLSNIEHRPQDKSIENYFKHGRNLIDSGVQIVLFIDEGIISLLFPGFVIPTNVKVIPWRYEQLWLLEFKKELERAKLPLYRYFRKDTVPYLTVLHQKTEWVSLVSQLNPFNTDSFTWIDFGASWMMESPLKEQHAELRRISGVRIPRGKVVAPGLKHPSALLCERSEYEIVNSAHFSFLGTLFACGACSAKLLNEYHRSTTVRLLRETSVLTWEFIIWTLVYRSHPDLFIHYSADHDDSLLKSFPALS